ncbi:bifunctional diaminohydroxyphosphoribosylaminopyrimidine deaminase/5-amino-6-(5-phosphoribosylamino)uracil reductase RibD [Ramlibacter sp.]|uniref:bifunctional diaminohydroxyphosphoribosylaminopyrimidine deaminase/5-amino-6-(5-phosphoribosylamino)uracil reductase RibD n=1 Tax=Ramlibacter sp. TaxID=1917967 RepID=UPI0017C57AFF|nr:bifunctional diaminohydroxyphosphoribosylaminopyrimidine deaminase/5-amino-6-(5-phosphoribosylamino)uracil reductase RibD [Ramlibacter sp.]MBA2674039.1 bifunctional diaminohydroxyphosphoribosylaminopyrimidine deaminase/5-amino-6-(5-phosphoribosylamino)uracil reductase RibD [Ramlibacter sp.]
MTDSDLFMPQALALAARAIGLSEPNPRVGCVLVAADGRTVLGQGHTQAAGQAHAEVMALRDAAARGQDVRGATAYVTLEPCSHHGRTGPCCDALIAAGIGRVVASLADPNQRVAGQGFARLRAAAIEVQTGPGAEASRELNIGFFSRMVRGTPWVRMKVAASLDGRTALDNGQSQWITGEAARADGHAWRARAGALLTGIGTVLEDDPLLTVRLAPVAHQPPLVVVDSRLETPPGARLFQPGRRVFIYTAGGDTARRASLEARGAQVVALPGPGGKVDLAGMLADLASREVGELHLEAGHKLNGSFVREGLVDEFLVYLAPRLLGQGRSLAEFGPLASLDAAPALDFHSVERIGADLRVIARAHGRDRF